MRLTKTFSAMHHPKAEGLCGDTRVQLCQGGQAAQPSLIPALPGHGGHRQHPRGGGRSAWSWGTHRAHMAQLCILVQPCPALQQPRPIPALIPCQTETRHRPHPATHPSGVSLGSHSCWGLRGQKQAGQDQGEPCAGPADPVWAQGQELGTLPRRAKQPDC